MSIREKSSPSRRTTKKHRVELISRFFERKSSFLGARSNLIFVDSKQNSNFNVRTVFDLLGRDGKSKKKWLIGRSELIFLSSKKTKPRTTDGTVFNFFCPFSFVTRRIYPEKNVLRARVQTRTQSHSWNQSNSWKSFCSKFRRRNSLSFDEVLTACFPMSSIRDKQNVKKQKEKETR